MIVKFKPMKTRGRYKIIPEWEGMYFRDIFEEHIPEPFILTIREELGKLGIDEVKINRSSKSVLFNNLIYVKTQIYFKNQADEAVFLFRYNNGMAL